MSCFAVPRKSKHNSIPRTFYALICIVLASTHNSIGSRVSEENNRKGKILSFTRNVRFMSLSPSCYVFYSIFPQPSGPLRINKGIFIFNYNQSCSYFFIVFIYEKMIIKNTIKTIYLLLYFVKNYLEEIIDLAICFAIFPLM